MKTAIITFHFVNNFGGALQAYALQETVRKECGSDVLIIDYRNLFITFTDLVRLFPITGNFREILSGLGSMGERFGRIRGFRAFRKNRMVLSPTRFGELALKADPPEADVYICGSDQIWNPFLTFGLRGPYFLDFVKDHCRRIAYAPSFGNGTIPSYFHPAIKKHLEKFDALSVRERTGIQLVKELTGRNADQLIDPTFLLTKEEWEKIAVPPDIQEPYLLLYIMQSDERMFSYARKLKERLKIPVVEISRYGYRPDFVDRTLVDVSPEEFLGLFQHAAYICTNSYHGFIFSLIFEKPFCLIPSKRFRARIYNLAELLSMEIREATPETVEDTVYDRKMVKNVISAERQRAVRWLKEKSSLNDRQELS